MKVEKHIAIFHCPFDKYIYLRLLYKRDFRSFTQEGSSLETQYQINYHNSIPIIITNEGCSLKKQKLQN